MSRITFEDLEALDDDDFTEDNSEPMDEEEQDRLFSHWQSVASTHQVSIPAEMAGPIQQMTRQSNAREPVPFATLSRHEKLDEVVYEERMYPAGKWACVTKGEELYEQSISMAFMKLMRYICKENSAGRYLGMTVPVLNEIQISKDGKSFVRDILTAYYLPAEFQQDPPEPLDPDIVIVQREPVRVVTRVFFGTTTEETISRQISSLWELLESTEDFLRDTYIVAVYENPGIPCRRNEIWFIRRDQ
ncbi:heme-binding protein soul4 [Erpetoichthys calabaricus]|uniref:Heme-binding protein soul4 n=1 Tax=Erpetoichthys calabaricus TaxID=27687 RepID=A0A8C4XH43_ERPCA|nr:heme-binding protein soul4 [Erpetoichthys calabaricus]XP_028676079.1 heme-binding protein soul4 [Erpetoichthys calabaricus]XP_028676080.1 heme-binding protein soul4 [Erpetoichthys calabaricus]